MLTADWIETSHESILYANISNSNNNNSNNNTNTNNNNTNNDNDASNDVLNVCVSMFL